LLQGFLRQNSMIDSGFRLCDVWQVNCCAVARGNFLLQSIQTGSGNHTASYSQDTWGFFHWWWNGRGMKLTADRHVVLRKRMCGAVSPLHMFLAPVQRDSCTFYFYRCHAHISLFAKWLGSVGEQTVIITELTSCELCLYHSAGAVTCDCAAVCSLLLALPESWKLWLWRAWKIILNCTWWIHVSITTAGNLQYQVCNSMYKCDPSVVTVIFGCFYKILKSDC